MMNASAAPVSKIQPLPLGEFVDEMAEQYPEMPRTEVVRRAKEAIQQEYNLQRKFLQSLA